MPYWLQFRNTFDRSRNKLANRTNAIRERITRADNYRRSRFTILSEYAFLFSIIWSVIRLCRPGRLFFNAHYYFPTFATVLSRIVYDSFHKSRPWSTSFDFSLYLFLDYRRYSRIVSYYICPIHFSNPLSNCFPRRCSSQVHTHSFWTLSVQEVSSVLLQCYISKALIFLLFHLSCVQASTLYTLQTKFFISDLDTWIAFAVKAFFSVKMPVWSAFNICLVFLSFVIFYILGKWNIWLFLTFGL